MAAKSEAAATSNVVEMAPSHASAPASPLRTESTMTVAPIIFPSKGENDIRKRRKREPIKLPPWVRAKLSANDLRRLKKKKTHFSHSSTSALAAAHPVLARPTRALPIAVSF
ncbi:hypothetical protein L915_02894 [Phytophthora nicotianae]|uniref:Uncharacterized protein n=1 Tax=Phytophthora nicotianae TaxID=4792 RepID=W2HFH8_PHYNI|nr:hypothetical protein L915_02894 [Phytophthora nicotianae]